MLVLGRALCAIAVLCARAAAPGAAMSVQYEAKPERAEFGLLEPIRIHLTIHNRGKSALDLPNPASFSSQPTYTLKGPSFPEGKTFSKVDLEPIALEPRPPPDSDRIRIDPGKSWDATVALGRSLQLEAAGEYQLESSLTVAKAAVRSPPEVFHVRPISPDLADVGLGRRDEGTGEGEFGFLQRTGSSTLLYAVRFREVRPDIGEAELFPPQLRSTIGAQATDLRVPWTNAHYNGELRRWLLWREGAKVHALDTYGASLSVDLGAAPAVLVRPALRPAGEEAEVLALGDGHRGVQLVRFTGKAGGVAWTAQLPAEAKSIAAALGPQAKNSPRHIALAAETEQGLAIFHARYQKSGAPQPFKSVRYEPQPAPGKPRPPARLFTAVPPALFVDGDDGAWASFIAVDGEQLVWIEARFAQGFFRDDLAVTATPLSPLAGLPVAGAFLYVDGDDGSVARRELVLQLENGGRVRFKEGALQRVSVQGTPTVPMVLVPGREVSYLLYTDPVRGPYLEPLH